MKKFSFSILLVATSVSALPHPIINNQPHSTPQHTSSSRPAFPPAFPENEFSRVGGFRKLFMSKSTRQQRENLELWRNQNRGKPGQDHDIQNHNNHQNDRIGIRKRFKNLFNNFRNRDTDHHENAAEIVQTPLSPKSSRQKKKSDPERNLPQNQPERKVRQPTEKEKIELEKLEIEIGKLIMKSNQATHEDPEKTLSIQKQLKLKKREYFELTGKTKQYPMPVKVRREFFKEEDGTERPIAFL